MKLAFVFHAQLPNYRLIFIPGLSWSSLTTEFLKPKRRALIVSWKSKINKHLRQARDVFPLFSRGWWMMFRTKICGYEISQPTQPSTLYKRRDVYFCSVFYPLKQTFETSVSYHFFLENFDSLSSLRSVCLDSLSKRYLKKFFLINF